MSANPASGGSGTRGLRVLVVEDERALASALEVAINVQPDLDCVGTAGTIADALPLVTTHRPDVVLMDIHLPGPSGIEGTRRIRQYLPHARVFILTADATPDLYAAAADAGAAGFLSKDSAFPDILDAIRSPAENQMLVEPPTLQALLTGVEHGRTAEQQHSNWAGLTARELEVLSLMGQGFDPATIARRLVVSVHTARGHVKNVMMKVGAHSQLEAVVIATRTGLLSGPHSAP
jgi:DNA-binding NarL/FixJ family response regulator